MPFFSFNKNTVRGLQLFAGCLFLCFWCKPLRAQEISAFQPRDILDANHCTKRYQPETLNYSQLPKEIEYRGLPVTALKWADNGGDNVLLLTETGEYVNNDPAKPDETQKAELYAYLYSKKSGEAAYSRRWKVYDFATCYDLDIWARFYPHSVAITDLDNDGTTEVTLIYSLFCGGGVDPADKKLIMYEGTDKYAIRGQSTICFENVNGEQTKDGGTNKADDKLTQQKAFFEFALKRWNVCDHDY